ncbi:hypothetical protein Emed_006447 [Eimeria media]
MFTETHTSISSALDLTPDVSRNETEEPTAPEQLPALPINPPRVPTTNSKRITLFTLTAVFAAAALAMYRLTLTPPQVVPKPPQDAAPLPQPVSPPQPTPPTSEETTAPAGEPSPAPPAKIVPSPEVTKTPFEPTPPEDVPSDAVKPPSEAPTTTPSEEITAPAGEAPAEEISTEEISAEVAKLSAEVEAILGEDVAASPRFDPEAVSTQWLA